MRAPRGLLAVLAFALSGSACASAMPPPQPTPPPAPVTPAGKGAPAAPASTASAIACTLLTGDDLQAVQGSALVETKGSDRETAGGSGSRCFLRTTDFARSVSVDVVLPQRGRSPRLGGVRAISPRERWQQLFHREGGAAANDEEREAAERPKSAPLSVAHLGEEAFWVGTAVSGALFVLQGDAYLRLSAGGPGDAQAKLARTRALAERALPRLAAALRAR